ncbi:hypothetical protein BASA83_012814 [Batrachochytrium salamandrivorans]|nr:hypothetical protein BASA83_012814 [Batrachochytrium salamandrivorans]
MMDGCYSSCEVFSGSIQGHGAGAIFGEDGQTGGGGATVMELDPTLIDASPKHFKKFPFSQELTSGSITYANTLSVGVTQIVRTGRYNGQTIGGCGYRARDYCSSPVENGQSKLHFISEPFEIKNPIGGFSLEVESAGIEEFIVFQADETETIIAQQKVATNKQKFAIPVSAAGSALGNNRIIIVGKTAGEQVLKTIRNVRTIPDDDKYMKISTTGFIFAGISDSVGLYQSPVTAPADGWNKPKGAVMIGDGVQYVSRVDSSIEAFFVLPLAPRSILVSMSLLIPNPIVISSTCLSKAVAVLKIS